MRLVQQPDGLRILRQNAFHAVEDNHLFIADIAAVQQVAELIQGPLSLEFGANPAGCEVVQPELEDLMRQGSAFVAKDILPIAHDAQLFHALEV